MTRSGFSARRGLGQSGERPRDGVVTGLQIGAFDPATRVAEHQDALRIADRRSQALLPTHPDIETCTVLIPAGMARLHTVGKVRVGCRTFEHRHSPVGSVEQKPWGSTPETTARTSAPPPGHELHPRGRLRRLRIGGATGSDCGATGSSERREIGS